MKWEDPCILNDFLGGEWSYNPERVALLRALGEKEKMETERARAEKQERERQRQQDAEQNKAKNNALGKNSKKSGLFASLKQKIGFKKRAEGAQLTPVGLLLDAPEAAEGGVWPR